MSTWKHKAVNYGMVLMLGIPGMYVVKDSFGYFSRVQGVSMQDTINPEKSQDIIFISRFNLFNKLNQYNIKHGDVVCFLSPSNADKTLIKRVVALDGDTVRAVNFNKKRVKTEYNKIPPGHCWVEGDNRNHSLDSNDFGPIPMGLITGKATHIVWPPSRWGPVKSMETALDRVQKTNHPHMQVLGDQNRLLQQ